MEEQKNGQESGKQGQKPHKRRKRYSGTHPKKYEEKYKELNPEKYGDTIEKVIGKGSTPAGMHISICVAEILDFLDIKPGRMDWMQHLAMADTQERCWKSWKDMVTFMVLTWIRLSPRRQKRDCVILDMEKDILTVKLCNFADIDKVAEEHGKFDFVLADLGVSSMQIVTRTRFYLQI